MYLVTLDEVRKHCRADGGVDDDAMLTIYANAAEVACAKLANRNLYVDSTARNAALAAMPTTVSAAWATYDAAMVAAGAMTDPRAQAFAEQAAQSELDATFVAQDAIMHGMVATQDIKEAVLLTAAHWYRNRETVTTGQGAAAVEMPMAADAIMSRYLWLGPL